MEKFGAEFNSGIPEQRQIGVPVRGGRGQPEMQVGIARGDPAARGAHQEGRIVGGAGE